MTQIKAHLMEKTLQLTVPRQQCLFQLVEQSKPFGHYAILKLFPLRSPSMKTDENTTGRDFARDYVTFI